MKVLYNWIKEFVDVKATPEDLRARRPFAFPGTAVEAAGANPRQARCLTPS